MGGRESGGSRGAYVLSIRAGKISSSMILRKLGNYSRKNRLYLAFRELGRVVRTLFLIEYLGDAQLRAQIDAETNKVESFHQFSNWMFFRGDETIRENDPEMQERIVKYNHLLANAVILQNAADLETVVAALRKEGTSIDKETVNGMSPYMVRNLKRFGDYLVDLDATPPPIPTASLTVH